MSENATMNFTTFFIGGLSYFSSESDIASLCGKFGNIRSISVIGRDSTIIMTTNSNSEYHQPILYATVTIKLKVSDDLVVRELDYTVFKGRMLR